MCLDLNKTVFFYENAFFYLQGQDSLKNYGGVNTAVKTLKSYFISNARIHRDNFKHLYLYLMHVNDKEVGSQCLIGSVRLNANYVDRVTITEDLIKFSGDKLILHFNL